MNELVPIEVRKILFSQYFVSGLQAASGVAGCAALGYAVAGPMAAFGIGSGAMCVSITDIPGPSRYKAFELAAAVVLGTIAMFMMTIARESTWATGLAILVLSFFAVMLGAYGKKTMPLNFMVFFVITIALGRPVPQTDVVLDVALFFAGGLCYTIYALCASRLLAFKTKQQALGECLFELSNYLKIKAGFYELEADLNACYDALITQQAVVIEKLQSARDFVFRQIRGERDAALARLLLGILDVYELILSSHTDYKLLQAQYAGSDILMFLRDLTSKAALDLELIAEANLRNRKVLRPVIYKAEQFAIEHEIDRLERELTDAGAAMAQQRRALAVLKGAFDRIRMGIRQIELLHGMAEPSPQNRDILAGTDLRPFLTPVSASPRIVLDQLTPESPIFRFAVRLTLAMGCGFVLAHFLPYATHSYWILLTIAVVMRSNFSVTRQRHNDRIMGNLIGCVLTAILLHFHPPAVLTLVVMFAAMAISHTFATIKYRYTAVAICIVSLLLVHFISDSNTFSIGERLIDTVIGATLAFVFSYILPSWEYRNIPRQMIALIKANAVYTAAAMGPGNDDYRYRLARKQLLDAIAILGGSFRRMLQEPKAYQRAPGELHDFIMSNYLYAAQVAALRILLQRRAGEFEPVRTTMHLNNANEQAQQAFTLAAKTLNDAGTAPMTVVVPPPQSPVDIFDYSDYPDNVEWDAPAYLQRRLNLINSEANQIMQLSLAVSGTWRSATPA